ncbi:biotin transporter BioY [Roseofilum sp. BLCC_M154]|uniref:Biotin transporter n=1 Tax=Roseofilum acuticapitatum BLCC-M154 TaxID=3022444 RepID=A0ABT7APC4_9CYAN|nr:biotin transporter BioY [Roseofilum acuticapitatum]MDJ1168156.1 biotin transporter BioY [Roseofilum acuticapitatum BLCC-M154]
MIRLNELLWAFIGLLLTIGGTFLEAFIASPKFSFQDYLLSLHSLGVNYQIGAVLLVGCMGGKKAGVLSQIGYLIMGLTWFPVFFDGGGLGYLTQPSFGYLLGFIPGAWICGVLAFRFAPRLEYLALSCLGGLVGIHLTGILYISLTQLLSWSSESGQQLLEEITKYSLLALPGHLVVACAATVIAYLLRHLMFY